MEEPTSGSRLKDPQRSPGGTAAVFAVLSFLAFWMTSTEFGSRAQSRDSVRWPKVSGAILLSSVHVGRGRYSTHCSYPAIRYTYTVAGRVYVGDRVTFAESCSEITAREVAAHYPEQTQVQVFYDPNAPGVSVLEPGTFETHGYGSIGAGLAAGVLFAFIAIEQALAFRRAR
jgi:hypothetical protein